MRLQQSQLIPIYGFVLAFVISAFIIEVRTEQNIVFEISAEKAAWLHALQDHTLQCQPPAILQSKSPPQSRYEAVTLQIFLASFVVGAISIQACLKKRAPLHCLLFASLPILTHVMSDLVLRMYGGGLGSIMD